MAVRPDNAPQFVDDGPNLWLRNVLENGKDKTEIEGRSIGREAPQVFDRTEIDGRLQRLRDAQQCCLAFESDDSLGELGQDGRQAPEPAADIARRREGEPRPYTRAQLSNVTLLEIRAQHCPGTVDVYHFARG